MSLALTFLHWRHQQLQQKSRAQLRSNIPMVTLSDLKKTAFLWIYQSIALNQIELARKMLGNIGENPIKYFQEIMRNTIRREIRSSLINYLEKQPNFRFSDEDQALIQYVHTLEQLYPTSKYSQIFEPLMKLRQNQKVQFSVAYMSDRPHLGGDIDDITPAIENEYGQKKTKPLNLFLLIKFLEKISQTQLGFQLNSGRTDINKNRTKILIPAPHQFISSHILQGYAQFSMKWISQWDRDTQQRILIEKKNNLPGVDLLSQLTYFVTHNNWHGVIDWVKKSPLEGSTDEFGHFQPKDEPLIKHIYDQLPRVALLCIPFMREVLLNELARKGIFLPQSVISGSVFDAQSSYSHQKSNNNNNNNNNLEIEFQSILIRLCKTNLLFLPKNQPSPKTNTKAAPNARGVPNLSNMLPFGRNSPFHTFFVQFCVQHSLHRFAVEYLEHYGLATTVENGKELNLDVATNPAWVRLLYHLRTRSNLFEASMINAQLVLKVI